MTGLLATRIPEVDQGFVPANIREKLREWQRTQMVFTLSLTAELFQVLEHFTHSRVEVLVTKGPPLSVRCYGDPAIRQYSDLDLIARSRDIQRSTEIMLKLGWEAKVPLQAIHAGKFPGEYVFFLHRGSKLLIEFHTERTFRYHPRPLPIEKLFARQTRVHFDGRDVPALSTEDELLLICIHGAKHFWTRLMWIADVAALIAHQPIDWDCALAAAREVSAERMLRVGLRLATDVLDLRLPTQIAKDVQSDVVATQMAEGIVRRLPLADSAHFALFERAAFRLRMRGGLMQGAAYLLRLSLSPTEEDWTEGAEAKRPWFLDALGRPFRLARKHGRSGRL